MQFCRFSATSESKATLGPWLHPTVGAGTNCDTLRGAGKENRRTISVCVIRKRCRVNTKSCLMIFEFLCLKIYSENSIEKNIDISNFGKEVDKLRGSLLGEKSKSRISEVTVFKLAKVEGLSLRARSSLRHGEAVRDAVDGDESDVALRPWRWRLKLMGLGFQMLTWGFALRISLLFFLIGAIATAFSFLPIEKILKYFLLWIKQDLGPWGPLVLAIAYIPLTVLAVPASVLTLGGGYLFGLPVGFIADSVGATIGATAAFLLGRTIGRSYVLSKLKNYPKFQVVAVAIQRSGFKIILLLRLVPLLPFNMLNYLLSVTPVRIGEYMLASWLGMMPITFAFVYIGTTLKDLSDITHGWNEVSTSHQIFIFMGFGISVISIVCITRIAKASLDKALAEHAKMESVLVPSMLPIVADLAVDIQKPLMIRIDPSINLEK